MNSTISITKYEDETSTFQEEWLTNRTDVYLSEYDYEYYDSYSIYEDSRDEAYRHYDLLSEMKKEIYLNTLAMIFHHWDKTFRKWIVKELRIYSLSNKFISSIWNMSFNKTLKFCELLGWNIKKNTFYKKLDILQLIVNVYKHGNGDSLKKLKRNYPESFDKEFISDFQKVHIDYQYLIVDLNQIEAFSSAISEFWKNIPKMLQGEYHLLEQTLNEQRRPNKKEAEAPFNVDSTT